MGGTAALPLIALGSVPHVPVKKSASAYRLLLSDYQAVYNPHALIPHQMKIDTQTEDDSSESAYELGMVRHLPQAKSL
jgi:hypothetical protein